MGSKKRAKTKKTFHGNVVVKKMPVQLEKVPLYAWANSKDPVNHPAHYGGDTTYEVIKVLRAWGLDRCAYLFQVVKYVARAGKKDPAKEIEDLEKARFYLDEKIKVLTQDRHDMLVKLKLMPLSGLR